MRERPLEAPVVGMVAAESSWSFQLYSAMVMPQSAESLSSAGLGKVPLKSERESISPLQFFSMYSVRSANWFWSLVPVTSSVSKVFSVMLTVCWSTTVWESVRREMT